jgi:hypothetical protein
VAFCALFMLAFVAALGIDVYGIRRLRSNSIE